MIRWAVGAVLLAVAALSIYSAFQSPAFVAGLSALAAAAALKAIVPAVTKRMPADQEAEWRKAQRLPDGDKDWKRRRLGLPPKG